MDKAQQTLYQISESDLSVADIQEVALRLLGEPLKPYTSGEHSAGMKTHITDHYRWLLSDRRKGAPYDIYLHWSYCDSCHCIRSKKLVLFNSVVIEYADGLKNNGIGITRWFVKNAEDFRD